jgi:hypothetical protein
MSELVQMLSSGRHQVEVSLRPERTVKALKDCLDRGYVHVKFTNTRGGTELDIPLDRARSDFSKADLEGETGRLTLVGEIKLDFVDVRCTADLGLPDMRGEGWLEPLGFGNEAT